MSTQHLQSTTDAEPTSNRTATRTQPAPSSAVTEDPRTATDRAPDVLAAEYGRLENLIDEWNAAFCEREHGTRPVRPRLDVVFAAESKPSLERRR